MGVRRLHPLRLARAAAAALALSGPAAAGAQSADTAAGPAEPLFTARDAAILGVFGFATAAIAPTDRAVAERLQSPYTQENRFLRGTAAVVTHIVEPGSIIIGGALYGIGRATDDERMAELGLRGTEAMVIGMGVNFLIKGLTGRARPYVSNDSNPRDFQFARGFLREQYRSFPSGHTVNAFAVAASVTQMTARWWPHSTWYVAPALYGGATLAGLSRMYNNKHWASDVIVGAAIGTLTGLKVERYHRTNPDNRVDRWLLAVSASGNGRGRPALRVLILPYH